MVSLSPPIVFLILILHSHIVLVDKRAVSSVCSGISKCGSRTSQQLAGLIVSENCNHVKNTKKFGNR